MQNEIEKLISRIRDCHPNMHLIYKFGGCYRFYLVLKVIWPEAEAWWDYSHVYSKIGKAWYDIDGKHVKPKNIVRMSVYSQAKHHRWDNYVHVTLDDGFIFE